MPTATRSQGALRRVKFLMYLNLVISVGVGVYTYLHFQEVVDYQLAHLPTPPKDAEATRATLTKLTWIRLGVVLALALIYLRIAARLDLGRRRTYVRLFVLTLGGCVAMGYLVVAGGSPDWTRAAQTVQGVVLLVLFFSLLGSDFRAHFFTPKSGR